MEPSKFQCVLAKLELPRIQNNAIPRASVQVIAHLEEGLLCVAGPQHGVIHAPDNVVEALSDN